MRVSLHNPNHFLRKQFLAGCLNMHDFAGVATGVIEALDEKMQ